MEKKLWLKMLEIFIGSFMIVITLASSVNSFNCDIFDSGLKPVCEEINKEDLSVKEKDFIISNLIYDSSFQANHSFIYDWNTKIDLSKAPEKISVRNGKWIKNAWLVLLTLMPSVWEDNLLYVPSDTTTLSAYNYNIKIPENYYSSGYPTTSKGDCKREYFLRENQAELKVFVNGAYQNNKKLSALKINQDSTVKSQLNINVGVDIAHYKWQKYCCRWGEFGCVKWCHECQPYSNEHVKDNLVLEDSKQVKFYDKQLLADLDFVDGYNGNTKIKPVFNNHTSIKVKFDNSQFKFYRYFYDLVPSYPPFHILTLRAHPISQQNSRNLLKEKDNLIVKNIDNCQIKGWNDFSEKTEPCNISEEKIDLEIKTDKTFYKANETIKVDIFPQDIPIEVSYNNKTITTQNSGQFIAQTLANKITARYNQIETNKIIHVSDGSKFSLAWDLSIFSFLNYFIYALLRRYFVFI